MIGDGMGLSQITAGLYYNGGQLELERFKHIGLMKTHSKTSIITDSAAGATAFATGEKTNNGAISYTKEGPIKSITEYAEEANKRTGVLSTSSVTHATPACFYGHQSKRSSVNEALALQFVSSGVDVLMGGGHKYFTKRKDGLHLLDSLKGMGYTVLDELNESLESGTDKAIYFCSPEHPKGVDVRGPFLPNATQKALNILNLNNDNGFFAMVEGAQIDWGGHDNNAKVIMKEMIDFDEAVGEALDFAEKDGNTLVIVTADHETGGHAITGGSMRERDIKTKFSTDYHTATMVPVFAYGPGAENFNGTYQNTAIFTKMMEMLNLSENKTQN